MVRTLEIKHLFTLLIILSLLMACSMSAWCVETRTAAPSASTSQTPSLKASKTPSATPSAGSLKKPAPTPAASSATSTSAEPADSGSPAATPEGTPSEEASSSATPTESAAASETPGETIILGIDVKKYMIPIIAGVGGLIVIFIVLLLLLGKKQKHVCEKCGRPVLPGMVFCEECADLKVSRMEEKPLPVTTTPAREPARSSNGPAVLEPVVKKKQRPSGRVIATITVRRGANQGYKFNFYETVNQITLGNDPDCDFVVEEDEEVSARHGVISMSEKDGFLIHDMGNTSGLYVNNERVKQSGLKSGDVIRMGKTEFTFARL